MIGMRLDQSGYNSNNIGLETAQGKRSLSGDDRLGHDSDSGGSLSHISHRHVHVWERRASQNAPEEGM